MDTDLLYTELLNAGSVDEAKNKPDLSYRYDKIHGHLQVAFPGFHGTMGNPRKICLAKPGKPNIAILHGMQDIASYSLDPG